MVVQRLTESMSLARSQNTPPMYRSPPKMPVVRCGPRARASGSMWRGGGCADAGAGAGAACAGGLGVAGLPTKRIWLPEGAHSQIIPCCWHLPQEGWIRSHLICCAAEMRSLSAIGDQKLACARLCTVLHTFLRLHTRQAETARGRGVAADIVAMLELFVVEERSRRWFSYRLSELVDMYFASFLDL
jgi:hypothetical protein